MPARFIVELLHTAVALLAALLAIKLAAWSYPIGAVTIWRVGYVAMAAVAGMNIPALRLAWGEDRGRARRG